MHLIATNLCVWIRTLINEIMIEFQHYNHLNDTNHGSGGDHGSGSGSSGHGSDPHDEHSNYSSSSYDIILNSSGHGYEGELDQIQVETCSLMQPCGLPLNIPSGFSLFLSEHFVFPLDTLYYPNFCLSDCLDTFGVVLWGGNGRRIYNTLNTPCRLRLLFRISVQRRSHTKIHRCNEREKKE